MKALVVTKEQQLEMQDILPPEPGPFQAMVKILACGICSTTDTELIKGTQPGNSNYPCVLGHEAIGEVIELGNKVRHFKVGDWVTRPVCIWPGDQRQGLSSAWGGFAEYGLITDLKAMASEGIQTLASDYTALRQNVLTRGKAIGLAASVLSIALAETADWCQKLEMKNKTVCVNGTGIAGLSSALWARLAGARRVIVLGRRDERLRLATELGADEIVNTRHQPALEKLLAMSSGGVDCFVEATGAADQMQIAVRSVRSGGTLGVYGVAPNGNYELNWKWLPLDIRITQHEPQEQLARDYVTRMIAEGKVPVEKLMTHKWKFDRFQDAFDAITQGSVVKSMLEIV